MFSSSQLVELFVVLCTADHYRYAASKVRSASTHAQSKSGPVRPDSLPTGLCVLASPLQGVISFLLPMIYILSVVGAGFQQPQWMSVLALPGAIYGVQLDGPRKNTIRVAVCMVDAVALQSVANHAFAHLGDQYHHVGRREGSRIVQTGPYAWVRHPLYALSLLQAPIWSLMFWSYAPLFALVANAAVLAVKIPMEEETILRDDAVREAYRTYMHKVPARVIPYVW